MKDKKDLIIVCLLLVIFLLIGIIFGVLVFNKTSPKETQKPENTATKELTTNEVLTMLEGEWGVCLGEYNCRGIIVSKNSDNEYLYTPYIMWSDGGEAGTVKTCEKIEEKIYKLTVYYKGYSNDMGSSPERTEEYKVNITDIESSQLTVNDAKYQKITGDRETFFNSIMQ